MPASIKMAREYGDDLAIIFVEAQGAPVEKFEKFAWDRKWMGTSAIWTDERFADPGGDGIPKFTLLSATGEVLMMGNPISMHKAIEETVTAEIEKAKSAPEGSPKSLGKAWKAFAKGDYAKAITEARKVAEKGDEDAEDAKMTADRFVNSVHGKFARAEWLMANGYLIKAQELSKSLAKSTKGLEDFAEISATLDEKFDSEDLKVEMAAAKAFAKLEEKLQEDGFDDKLVKKLTKFAEKNSETMAGKRANHLLKLANAE